MNRRRPSPTGRPNGLLPGVHDDATSFIRSRRATRSLAPQSKSGGRRVASLVVNADAAFSGKVIHRLGHRHVGGHHLRVGVSSPSGPPGVAFDGQDVAAVHMKPRSPLGLRVLHGVNGIRAKHEHFPCAHRARTRLLQPSGLPREDATQLLLSSNTPATPTSLCRASETCTEPATRFAALGSVRASRGVGGNRASAAPRTPLVVGQLRGGRRVGLVDCSGCGWGGGTDGFVADGDGHVHVHRLGGFDAPVGGRP
jgi:hypothetical protein